MRFYKSVSTSVIKVDYNLFGFVISLAHYQKWKSQKENLDFLQILPCVMKPYKFIWRNIWVTSLRKKINMKLFCNLYVDDTNSFNDTKAVKRHETAKDSMCNRGSELRKCASNYTSLSKTLTKLLQINKDNSSISNELSLDESKIRNIMVNVAHSGDGD